MLFFFLLHFSIFDNTIFPHSPKPSSLFSVRSLHFVCSWLSIFKGLYFYMIFHNITCCVFFKRVVSSLIWSIILTIANMCVCVYCKHRTGCLQKRIKKPPNQYNETQQTELKCDNGKSWHLISWKINDVQSIRRFLNPLSPPISFSLLFFSHLLA